LPSAWFLLTHGIDLLFALDSTPAVFGAVTAPFIVFTVNAFVLLGLRALSLLIKVLLELLVGLSAGLAVHHRLHRRHVGPAVAARRHIHTRFPRPLSRSRAPRSSGS
jgi:hypothetical protein